MVDYSRWDRMDFDSDSDGGEGETRRRDEFGDGGFGGEQGNGGKQTIHYPNGDFYEGELKDCMRHGSGSCRFQCGGFYEGEWKDDLMHGKGISTAPNGNVYEGEFVEGGMHGKGKLSHHGHLYEGDFVNDEMHGKGIFKYKNGDVCEGEFKDGLHNGWGKMTYASGDVYEGEFKKGKRHGHGTLKYSSGCVYEGGFVDEKQHGKGTMKWSSGDVYEGQWKDEKQHGRGTMTYASGKTYEGEWVKGKEHGKGTLKYPSGDIYEGIWAYGQQTQGRKTWASMDERRGADDAAPKASCELLERQMRSQRSQQRRLQKNLAVKACEHCGVDDIHFKLRACSGCNLALYCSAACQKAANRSHRRICNIFSVLPPREFDRLHLEFDKEKRNDFDAGLRYATKYMDNLKHLAIDIMEMRKDDTVKLSAKQLSSLLRSKRGALDSVFWKCSPLGIHTLHDICEHDAVWKELCDLKQLCLRYMRCDEVQPLHDIIHQQRNTLMVLWVPFLRIEWHKAKCRRSLALAVSACNQLVKLSLNGCVLTDSDLKIMLRDMPNLRLLGLTRDEDYCHEGFTDNTCGLIARKCPGLQELNLDYHEQLSARGIRKIFEGCVHLRSFCTTTRKLSCGDLRNLLDTAPQLLCISLNRNDTVTDEDLYEIIEATSGRTLLHLDSFLYEPQRKGLSAETVGRYQHQQEVYNAIFDNRMNPELANEWEGMFEG